MKVKMQSDNKSVDSKESLEIVSLNKNNSFQFSNVKTDNPSRELNIIFYFLTLLFK